MSPVTTHWISDCTIRAVCVCALLVSLLVLPPKTFRYIPSETHAYMMLNTHLNTSVLRVYWNVAGYYVSNHRCIYALCHVPSDLPHVLYTRTECVCSAASSTHTGERSSISLSCHHCSTVRANTYRNRCRAWCIPASNMLSCAVELYCVVCAFFWLFSHTFLFGLHCFTCHSSVLYVVNELNRSSTAKNKINRTEPNRCVSVRFDNSMSEKKRKKKPTTITNNTEMNTFRMCSEVLSSTRFLVTFIHISFFDIFGQAHLLSHTVVIITFFILLLTAKQQQQQQTNNIVFIDRTALWTNECVKIRTMLFWMGHIRVKQIHWLLIIMDRELNAI